VGKGGPDGSIDPPCPPASPRGHGRACALPYSHASAAFAYPTMLTVFSMIGLNPAAAFNRDWQRKGILNARFEMLFELNTTALIPDEALSIPHAERKRRANRRHRDATCKEVESVASARNGNDTGADMRSVLSLAMFAIVVLCFVAFVTEVRPVSIVAAPSSGEQARVQ
jgi:hypothetical protein